MRILLARHADDVGPSFSDEKRELTKKGTIQARKLGEIIKKFKPTCIYSSPLLRAKETTEIVSEFCKIQFIILNILREQKTNNEESIQKDLDSILIEILKKTL
ncbi:MAG: histidine phosphatase family protein [Candidatus Heimdallarchaeota archaeon]